MKDLIKQRPNQAVLQLTLRKIIKRDVKLKNVYQLISWSVNFLQ